jgi:hypothetical protein
MLSLLKRPLTLDSGRNTILALLSQSDSPEVLYQKETVGDIPRERDKTSFKTDEIAELSSAGTKEVAIGKCVYVKAGLPN